MKKISPDPVWISGFLALILFFSFRRPSDRFDLVIAAEGIGYYSYLPSVFLNHNLQWKDLVKQAEPYYGRDIRIDFVNNYKGHELNKYFPGVSFLMLPFFLGAWILSILFNYPVDGYGPFFQYCIGLGSVFYTIIGLHYTRKWLRLFFPENRFIEWACVLVFWGSNLLYNSVFNSTQSHPYSFFTTAAFLFYFSQFYGNNRKLSALPKLGFMLALSVCIRPTFVLVFLFLPVICRRSIKDFFFLPLQSVRKLVTTIILTVFPVLIMLIAWKIQSGVFFPEAYKGEYFNFSQPHVLDILFSFRKGWFTYHPVMAISSLGIVSFWIMGYKREAFWSGLFLVVSVYVFSCWWIWTYAVPFGQRVFIDFYPILAFLLAHFLVAIQPRVVLQKAVVLFLVSLCLFNVWRTWQYYKGILPWEYVNAEVFFKTIPIVSSRSWYLVNEPRVRQQVQIGDLNLTATPGKPDTLLWKPDQRLSGPLLHFRLSGQMYFSHSNSYSKVVFRIYYKDSLIQSCERYCGFFSKEQEWMDTQLGFEMPRDIKQFDAVELILDPGMENVSIGNAVLECLLEDPVPEFIETNGRK